MALRISDLLGVPPEYLFDPILYGKRPARREIAIEVYDEKWMEAHTHLIELAAPPEDEIVNKEIKLAIGKTLATLTPREEEVIRMRFGLDGMDHTFEEVGEIFGVTKERIRQIEATALRKIRHPARSKRLRAASEGVDLEDKEKR